MKTIWTLVTKDLLRDARNPWGILIFMVIPVLTAVLIAMVFSPQAGAQPEVTIDLAVLDRDDDFLSAVLRSLSGQGDAGEHLRMHFVDAEEEGIRLLERRKVSAFVVLPEDLSVDLLDGRETRLTLYKNPAEAILPRVVEEGLLVFSSGVSEALRLVRPELRSIRAMVEREAMPSAGDVARISSNSVERLRAVETYLFPPLVQFETLDAADYHPGGSAPAVNDPEQSDP